MITAILQVIWDQIVFLAPLTIYMLVSVFTYNWVCERLVDNKED